MPAFHAKRSVLLSGIAEKGGVGKTFFVRLLLDWLERNHGHRSRQIFDTDRGSPVLSRHYADAKLVELGDDDHMNADVLLNDVGTYDFIVTDFRAGSLKPLLQWMKDVSFDETLGAIDADAVFFHVIADDPHALAAQCDTLTSISGARIRHVMVLNMQSSADFPYYQASALKALVNRHHHIEIAIPALHPAIARKINGYALTFSAAQCDTRFTVAERARIANAVKESDLMITRALQNLQVVPVLQQA